MLSDGTIKALVASALFVHAAAHAVALGALADQFRRGMYARGVQVRYWLYPALPAGRTAAIAFPFWAASTVGFLAAAMSFWGILIPAGAWRAMAVASASVSLLSICLFCGAWPGSPTRARSRLNTLIAVGMNAAVLVSLLVLHWPEHSMFDR